MIFHDHQRLVVVVVVVGLDVDADDVDVAEAGLERRFRDLAYPLLVHVAPSAMAVA